MSLTVKSSVARMAKQVHLRPSDQGRKMSLEEFEHASGQNGHRYELIDGKVEVSPWPEFPHDVLLEWLADSLREYRRAHSERIKKVTTKARVYLPSCRPDTCPDPDLAVYDDVPKVPIQLRTWHDISPSLVGEVIFDEPAKKDLERNVELYLEVPSVREYWIVDGRLDADKPQLIVYRRRGRNWQKPIVVPFGETYETKMLPGFKLVVDPHVES